MNSVFCETIPNSITACNTLWYFRDENLSATMASMGNADQRRDALRRLISERANGVVSDFCDRYDLNPVYIRALVAPGSTKSFGEKAARRLEDSIGLPARSLDQPTTKDHAAVIRQIESLIHSAAFLSDDEKNTYMDFLKSRAKARASTK